MCMYQNDRLKWKSKFLCIQSLILEVKGLKQGYIFKNRPFYISFVLFNTFPSRSEYSKKKSLKKKKIVSYLPTLIFFQGVTRTTHIFFIWPNLNYQFQLYKDTVHIRAISVGSIQGRG